MFHLMEQGLINQSIEGFSPNEISFAHFSSQVWLSTSPTQPLTHWYQVRCLFVKPLTVSHGQVIQGHVILHSNRK